jgi:N-acetylneuraminic acid mutarotase
VGTLAEGRFFHRLFVRDGALVAVGGIGSMTTDGRARLVESMPLDGARTRVSVATIDYPGATRNRPGLFVYDDSLFLFGGNDSTGQHDFAPENFETAGFRLHLPSLRWFALPPLPEGRQSLVSVVHGGTAIAVGGFGHDEDASRTYADAFVLRADEEAPSWRQIRDMLPLPRTQFGMVEHDGALWIVGGLEYDAARPEDAQFVHLASVLRCPLDAEALASTSGDRAPIGACEELPAAALPGTRRAFGSALLDGRIYVVGGMREDFAPVPDCAVLDLATLRWSEFACPSAVRISPDLLAYDGKLYLLGGTSRRDGASSSGPDRSVEVFDPATGAWSTLIDALPVDTHQMRFVRHEHRIVGVSTQERAGRATLVWIDPG